MTSTAYNIIGHSSEHSDGQTLAHSRNLSTISDTTLHTNTTVHSQPYEPLLRPITPGSEPSYEIAYHTRSSDRALALPRWSHHSSGSKKSKSVVLDEKRSSSTIAPARQRFRRLKWTKNILGLIITIWTIYNTARYLNAFTIYDNVKGQAFSLVLGACTGLSFTFFACASILSFTQMTLLAHGISVQTLVSLRSVLRYLSTLCLLGPGIVNLVLIIISRRTNSLELQPRYRCHLDVDLIWSTTQTLCHRKDYSWGVWLFLAIFRVVLTLAITSVFHIVAASPQFLPIRRHKGSFKKSKSHSRLDSFHDGSAANSNASLGMPRLDHEHHLQHQSSDSTLSAKSSPRNRFRSRASVNSDEEVHSDAPSYNDTDYISMPGNQPSSGRDLNGFVDRFRSLISQITRETEEGLAFARSDGGSSGSPRSQELPEIDVEYAHVEEHHEYEEEDDFYSASPSHAPNGDYHQAYPAEEHIRMMNGYIRRMPTIESVGSKELRNSIDASSFNTHRERERPNSRPPTRNTLASWNGSDFSGDHRSPSNSLSAQAELLAGMFGKDNASEIGELMRKGDTIRMVDSSSVHTDNSEALGNPLNGYSSSTSGSRATGHSYHTAPDSTVSSTSTGKSSDSSLRRVLEDATQTPLERT
ncbi:hypothetical protein BJ165DRAFT_1592738 [Panaeolus papilionaceus]|nr:hypothetical protein BJ165DRAFT_1592738 [Panaeolus papilionaceus]